MAENFRKGDKVRWNSHGSEASGEVEEKITEDTEAAGWQVRAEEGQVVSDHDDIRGDFGEAVNMTPTELGKWLASDESKSVGVTSGRQKKSSSGRPESVGHDSGEKILTILRKNKSNLNDDDFAHMRKVPVVAAAPPGHLTRGPRLARLTRRTTPAAHPGLHPVRHTPRSAAACRACPHARATLPRPW
jgi:hypothetical protein